MERMLVISDIHGELVKFERLLEMACYDANRDQLLLLGDYIDRGPHSREVIAKVRELHQLRAIVLMGNHEKMMLDAYRNKEKAVERWFRNGAKQTLLSYGYTEDEATGRPAAIRWTGELLDVISFVDKLPYYYETDEYIFVHAGVEPGMPLAACDPHKLLWIRGEFHKGYSGPKTVIFGHSPAKLLHGSDEVYFGANSIIGIDGGCVYGGRLNCLELPSRHIYYVE
ncbi:serine/threonine protein phosphatase [Paenibacillus dendritiformis]|uniref:metallophosphoesterase family protein n=1 Tax=Paenibacillus dendritiformis TaxID=130049 RepID=UPI00143DAE20|nr:metallophosphoesterase family protein [Paenibacillus dendritiformis]NKI22548.1 serine/threonine protein phosphatase [Paenibacillus dendritiformis]NRG00799.1 serine/threonine protein phosphatase [Paenibacillus dendritiformis]